jgi:hypothetical protein
MWISCISNVGREESYFAAISRAIKNYLTEQLAQISPIAAMFGLSEANG